MKKLKRGIFMQSIVVVILLIVSGLLFVKVKDVSRKNENLSEQLTECQTELSVYKDVNYGINAHGQLSVQGTQLCDENGQPVQLKGMSTHGITWYPRYTNAAALKTIKEYGANVIRLAVYSDENESYLSDKEKNLDYLYNAIENALAQNMYVIVDWHVLQDANPLVHKQDAEEFFEEISSHYGNHPGILYEICNEPNGDTKWDDIVDYANDIIPLIRKNAPDSVIIVGTPGYSYKVEAVKENPLAFSNVMYALHAYIDVTYEEDGELHWLAEKMDLGLPVFVSEWGITDNDKMDADLYEENAVNFLKMMEERNISWCNWSLSNKDEIYSMILPECDKYSGWTEEDLTFSGKIILNALQN